MKSRDSAARKLLREIIFILTIMWKFFKTKDVEALTNVKNFVKRTFFSY